MDQDLQDEQLKRTKQISRTIRQAIRESLPGSPEQFLTLMIPGKVVDLKKLSKDYSADGKRMTALPSREVQLSEAILCDDMPTLGPLQLGPTGRSVARSYAATLSKLCPAGSTTGLSDKVVPEDLNDSEKRYKHAMSWLTFRDPNNANKTRVDLYREKQLSYTAAFERKTRAFREALEKVPKEMTVEQQREEYDKWVAENYKTYNNLIQAAYMDWVTMGKKEEVEYYFSIVDNDSAMARVEASKECMRLMVVTDADGSSEYQKVKLEPENWAWFALNKAAAGPKGETVESLTFKISRLQKINILLASMAKNKKLIPINEGVDPEPTKGPSKSPEELTAAFLAAQKEFDDASAECTRVAKGGEKKAGEDGKVVDPMARVEKASGELETARKELRQHFEKVDRDNVKSLSSKDREAQKQILEDANTKLEDQIGVNRDLIKRLESERAVLESQQGGTPNVTEAMQDEFAEKAGIPRAPPPSRVVDKTKEGSWTSISVEVSSSFSSDSYKSSSTSTKAEASYSWGLFGSVSGGMSYQQSQSTASREMANASMKISFECMRVDITRPWLRAELFYDHDLRVVDKNFVSPGPERLAPLIDASHPKFHSMDSVREKDMADYDLFPMYPTAFLIAANVVLEIHGESSAIQSHLSSSAASGNVGLSYGPFSIGGSASHSSNEAGSTCRSTAAGCRITIDSPQIIGWISQIIPELPRSKPKYVPDHA